MIMPPNFDRDSIPAMLVDEESSAVSRMVGAYNQVDELAYVTRKPASFYWSMARQYMRPADHPRGRQYLSGAVAEMYAGYRINCPGLFEAAKRPALVHVLAQVRAIQERGEA